jgi:acyl-CoA reductase-like NAD-dependent aldehyde dehydrogenase
MLIYHEESFGPVVSLIRVEDAEEGVKNSGFGREGGRSSWEELTEQKWITIQMGRRQFPF